MYESFLKKNRFSLVMIGSKLKKAYLLTTNRTNEVGYGFFPN